MERIAQKIQNLLDKEDVDYSFDIAKKLNLYGKNCAIVIDNKIYMIDYFVKYMDSIKDFMFFEITEFIRKSDKFMYYDNGSGDKIISDFFNNVLEIKENGKVVYSTTLSKKSDAATIFNFLKREDIGYDLSEIKENLDLYGDECAIIIFSKNKKIYDIDTFLQLLEGLNNPYFKNSVDYLNNVDYFEMTKMVKKTGKRIYYKDKNGGTVVSDRYDNIIEFNEAPLKRR